MSKSWSKCEVTVSGGTASCDPDPVPVVRGSNKGVKWVMTSKDYVFTGVDITTNTSDFGEPEFSKNDSDKSVMKVSDTVDDVGEYSYTILFRDKKGNEYSHDPKIHNKV